MSDLVRLQRHFHISSQCFDNQNATIPIVAWLWIFESKRKKPKTMMKTRLRCKGQWNILLKNVWKIDLMRLQRHFHISKRCFDNQKATIPIVAWLWIFDRKCKKHKRMMKTRLRWKGLWTISLKNVWKIDWCGSKHDFRLEIDNSCHRCGLAIAKKNSKKQNQTMRPSSLDSSLKIKQHWRINDHAAIFVCYENMP